MMTVCIKVDQNIIKHKYNKTKNDINNKYNKYYIFFWLFNHFIIYCIMSLGFYHLDFFLHFGEKNLIEKEIRLC